MHKNMFVFGGTNFLEFNTQKINGRCSATMNIYFILVLIKTLFALKCLSTCIVCGRNRVFNSNGSYLSSLAGFEYAATCCHSDPIRLNALYVADICQSNRFIVHRQTVNCAGDSRQMPHGTPIHFPLLMNF